MLRTGLGVASVCACAALVSYRSGLRRLATSAPQLLIFGGDSGNVAHLSLAEGEQASAHRLQPTAASSAGPLGQGNASLSLSAAGAASTSASTSPPPTSTSRPPAAAVRTTAVSPAPSSSAAAAASPKAASPADAQRYGFYIHAFNFPAAVVYQVRQVKKFFPGSPIYIMSDGGFRFDKLCKVEGCIFTLCPPANDRWHPWPFMRRMYDAAVALKTEFVIMLEPDNTIYGPITRPPTHDAGGLFVEGRGFGKREYAEKLAQQRKPGFKWRTQSMRVGLCGGSYYRTTAVLDAFNDEAIARIDWNYLGETTSKETYSSDFAMPYVLAARGWEVEPWDDAAQMEQSATVPHAGPADAAFKHYGGGYPGGKPTYRLQLSAEDAKLVDEPLEKHRRYDTNCQVCWDLDTYVERWGSAVCTNHLPFSYSPVLIERYHPEYSTSRRP